MTDDEIKRLRAAGNDLWAWLMINSTTQQQHNPRYGEIMDAWEALSDAR